MKDTLCVDRHNLEAMPKYKYFHHEDKVRDIGVDYLHWSDISHVSHYNHRAVDNSMFYQHNYVYFYVLQFVRML